VAKGDDYEWQRTRKRQLNPGKEKIRWRGRRRAAAKELRIGGTRRLFASRKNGCTGGRKRGFIEGWGQKETARVGVRERKCIGTSIG